MRNGGIVLFRRVEVTGVSMVPTLLPGDRLLVVHTRKVRPGDLAVLADPTDPTRTLVKRVEAVTGDRVSLRGDNSEASTDSRTYGMVPLAAVVGRVWYRYAPRGRTGRPATAGPRRSWLPPWRS